MVDAFGWRLLLCVCTTATGVYLPSVSFDNPGKVSIDESPLLNATILALSPQPAAAEPPARLILIIGESNEMQLVKYWCAHGSGEIMRVSPGSFWPEKRQPLTCKIAREGGRLQLLYVFAGLMPTLEADQPYMSRTLLQPEEKGLESVPDTSQIIQQHIPSIIKQAAGEGVQPAAVIFANFLWPLMNHRFKTKDELQQQFAANPNNMEVWRNNKWFPEILHTVATLSTQFAGTRIVLHTLPVYSPQFYNQWVSLCEPCSDGWAAWTENQTAQVNQGNKAMLAADNLPAMNSLLKAAALEPNARLLKWDDLFSGAAMREELNAPGPGKLQLSAESKAEVQVNDIIHYRSEAYEAFVTEFLAQNGDVLTAK